MPGFVPAMERLPGLSVSQGHFDPSLNPHYQEDDDGGVRECAACERLHSRATVELLFKGRPYWPEYKYGIKCAPPPSPRCLVQALGEGNVECACAISATLYHPFRDDVFLLIGPRWRHGEHACLLVTEDMSLDAYDMEEGRMCHTQPC